jgi:hypothetical protein
MIFSQHATAPKVSMPAASPTYSTAIGVRAGGTSGITVKHFVAESNALEVILGLWYHGFSITGLYERHAPSGIHALRWYYGIGAHIAIETEHEWHRWRGEWWVRDRTEAVGIGIDGVLGVEYKIPPIPFAISLDVKPFLEVLSTGGVIGSLDPGLGIKIAF